MRRRYRLRRSADFDELRRKGQRWHHPMVMLIANPNGRSFSRFGFVASRRFGKATARNRIKRLLREAVRSNMTRIEDGWDCMFVARQAANGAAYVEVEAAVYQLLKVAKMLKPSASPQMSSLAEERQT